MNKNDYERGFYSLRPYSKRHPIQDAVQFDRPYSLESLIEYSTLDKLIQNSSSIELDAINIISTLLWEKYLDCVRCDNSCIQALEDKAIEEGDHVLKFSLDIIGDKPAEGYSLYIALHGGGSCPAELNDSQWEHMKIYYRDCVKSGIYVATRGITDNWNLHFEDASYRLYDKLIKMLVALHNVNPNRVYLLGFSAGGDGVYQAVPRMPDLWAAANMSAGHSNGIRLDNLYQVPFLMQMGELDSAYDRNKVAVQNYRELTRLNELRGGYERELFIHKGKGHNGWYDHDPLGRDYFVLVKNEYMLTGEQTFVECDTSAVNWLDKYKRNPYPTKIFWDPTTNAPRHIKNGAIYLKEDPSRLILVEPRYQCYWLSLGHNPELSEGLVIEAELDKDSNAVKLKSLGSLKYISILLNSDMLDLKSAISIEVDGSYIGSVEVKTDLRVMVRTLLERGDIHYVFPCEIVLVRDGDNAWRIKL